MVLTRHRASNWMGLPFGLLVVWVLWADVEHRMLLAWLVAKVLVCAWRIAITWRFDRDRASLARVLHWSGWFDRALFADGVVFGLLGTWLMPPNNPVLAAIMVATLLGIAALALVVLAARERSCLLVVLPILLPTMVLHLAQGNAVSTYIGAGVGIFLFLALFEGRKATLHTRDMLRLRFQMDELASQRAQALDLAERNGAVKDRFLATMSHEMRTPLHGILGIARLLQQPSTSAASAQLATDGLMVLERTGEHLLAVINDVLDFSKMQSGHLGLVDSAFDLHALVHSVVDVARVAASDKDLSFELGLRLPQPCWVSGDPMRLRQILLNLTGNAVKFTPQGRVRLDVEQTAPNEYRFDICDSGPGVAREHREAVFEAFHQLDGSDQRRHGGTGLGLTISRELTQLMQGRLECLDGSQAGQGQRLSGALFRLTLNLKPAPKQAAQAQAELGSAGLFSGRVLLVEDNPVNALVAEAVLQGLGLQVDAAVDGQQAIERFTAQRYDLVLMDCQMPVLDGYGATRRIRQIEAANQSVAVPIVALTAHAMPGDRERSLAAGMNEHLTKPFSREDLVVMLQRFLGPTARPAG